MTWTPEMIYGTIVAVGTGAVAVAGALNKLKIVSIPFRRNGNQFSGMGISEIEKRCREIHAGVDHRLTEFDKSNSEQASDIRHMEKRLDKGDEKFDKIHDELKTISTNIGKMDTRFEAREKDLTNTITDATSLMREFLLKTG